MGRKQCTDRTRIGRLLDDGAVQGADATGARAQGAARRGADAARLRVPRGGTVGHAAVRVQRIVRRGKGTGAVVRGGGPTGGDTTHGQSSPSRWL